MWRNLILAVIVGLLGGCTPMRWTKNGVDSTTMEKDISACSTQARIEAQSEDLTEQAYIPVPMAQQDGQGQPVVVWGQRRVTDPGVREQSRFNLCMKAKGYELVPAAPSPPVSH